MGLEEVGWDRKRLDGININCIKIDQNICAGNMKDI